MVYFKVKSFDYNDTLINILLFAFPQRHAGVGALTVTKTNTSFFPHG